MSINELNNKLSVLLKEFLKSRGHYGSGKLYNSIRFKCSETKTSFDIKLDAEEYIYYLEDGRFIDNFYELDSVANVFAEYIEDDVVEQLEEDLEKLA